MHVFHGGRCRYGILCNPFVACFSLSTVQRYDNAAAQSCTFLTSCSTLFAILSSPLYIVRFIYRGMILFFATPHDRIPSKSKKVSYLANMNVFIPGSPFPFLPAQSQRFCMEASVLQGVPDVRAWRRRKGFFPPFRPQGSGLWMRCPERRTERWRGWVRKYCTLPCSGSPNAAET